MIALAGVKVSFFDAAMLLGVCRRQVYRLLDRLRADGPEPWFPGSAAVRATGLRLLSIIKRRGLAAHM
ncbi:hypothetical protein [Tardiphaga sp.]|uniref:hypothetical protein n=1 Tax=Tardiphaga sp. TaxID=1926292 RepID=UPI00352B292B